MVAAMPEHTETRVEVTFNVPGKLTVKQQHKIALLVLRAMEDTPSLGMMSTEPRLQFSTVKYKKDGSTFHDIMRPHHAGGSRVTLTQVEVANGA
jgi:hypothetical protein